MLTPTTRQDGEPVSTPDERSILVRVVSNYGSQAAYPVDRNGELFARLAGTRTLTRATLEVIKQLGYEVKVQAEVPTL